MYARDWLSHRLRVVPGRKRRWAEVINCKKVCASFNKSDFLALGAVGMGSLATMPSLRAHVGPWRLPRLPTVLALHRQLRSQLHQWCMGHRIPARARHSMRAGLERVLPSIQVPERPPQWLSFEAELKDAVHTAECVVQDDKDPTKVWTVQPAELQARILSDIVKDSGWVVQPAFTKEMVQAWSYSRSCLGLPWFLRRPRGRARPTGLPLLFAFVKSKCFND